MEAILPKRGITRGKCYKRFEVDRCFKICRYIVVQGLLKVKTCIEDRRS